MKTLLFFCGLALSTLSYAADSEYHGLLGAIWQARENLSFDIGLRRGDENHLQVVEIWAGLTWLFICGMWREALPPFRFSMNRK